MSLVDQGPKLDGYRVLIVGCGQLGSRHLQAVASLPLVREIEVVDPRPQALELGRERVAEVRDHQPSTDIRWLSSLSEATRGGDLCIIATQAQGRCRLVRDVVETLGYSAFLLEKIVARSVREMEDLVEFSRVKGLSAWVNCQTRAYPFHKRVKQHLDPADPIIFTVVGGNQGLATDGVHLADLFTFYDESPCIESNGSRIDPILHPSKRGNGLFDLSGALHGYTRKGSCLTISYTSSHRSWDQVSIATGKYRCIVDHLQQWSFECGVDSDWAWRQVPLEGIPLVSQITREFATDILTSGRCALPTLEESLVAHRFILGELQPHFSRLLGREIDLCPVT